MLRSIAGQNYQDYLQIPEGFPSRIRLLARRITAWYNDDYDKVKAIEEYLSDNYSYTLEPSPVPLGRDFVDFFLFDGKKGYCTYFATAMTMMLRTIGIPARYVEGYILPPEPADGNSERYIVTNQNAHAWPEVYFEGVGWIAFEPTPPFNPTFYTAQAISNDKVSGVSGSPFYEELMEEEELYDDLLYPGYSITPDGEEKSSNKYLLILIILALSLCLVLLLASFNIIRLRISLHIIRKSDPGKAIVKIFSYYFKLLAFAGFRLAQGETVSEYVKRLEKYVILPKESGRIPDFVNVIKIEKNETNKKVKWKNCLTFLSAPGTVNIP